MRQRVVAWVVEVQLVRLALVFLPHLVPHHPERLVDLEAVWGLPFHAWSAFVSCVFECAFA